MMTRSQNNEMLITEEPQTESSRRPPRVPPPPRSGGRWDWEAWVRLIRTHRPAGRFRRRLDDVDVSPSFRPASGFDDNDFDGGSTTYDCESSSPPSDSEESEEDSCPPPNRAGASSFDASGQEESPQHNPTADTTNIEVFANVAAAVESIRPSNIPGSSFSRDSTAIQQSMSNVPTDMMTRSQNNGMCTTEGPRVRSRAQRVGKEASIMEYGLIFGGRGFGLICNNYTRRGGHHSL